MLAFLLKTLKVYVPKIVLLAGQGYTHVWLLQHPVRIYFTIPAFFANCNKNAYWVLRLLDISWGGFGL